MDELDALNRRTRELLPHFRLPNNVALIYASGDRGREELIGNKAIAECDRRSGELITRIEAGESPPGDFQTTMPHFCSRYRFWLETT